MKKSVLVLVVFVMTLLSACSVKPAAARHVHVAKPIAAVRTVQVLEKEHTSHAVAIVTLQPSGSRNCWTHQQHWHCSRP